jgi:hypothetical protein
MVVVQEVARVTEGSARGLRWTRIGCRPLRLDDSLGIHSLESMIGRFRQ